MRVSEHDTLDGLIADLSSIPARAVKGTGAAVRRNAKEGNRLALGFARHSAGSHGRNYPGSFSAELVTALSWEYGPRSDGGPHDQGGMSFEWGSRNQPPHLDLNKSADIIGPKFAKDIGDVLDGLFW